MGIAMNYHDFNFAEPMWLLGLLLIPAGWGWYKFWQYKSKQNTFGLNKFIDPHLLPHLLIQTNNKNTKGKIGWLYALLVACIAFALANPRWSFKELDAFQPTASMVILLDLSSSMTATDVSPSRIVRARQNIIDLLNLSKGMKIGLIGFAGNPHLISPITDDIQTIKTYVPALDTDLTAMQGNSLPAALKMAGDLLINEPGDKKSILLISDGNFVVDDLSKEISVLNAHNIHTHVMGVGTTTGAPYKDKNGSLHKLKGKVITSKLNVNKLQEIAKHGHGIYTEAKHNDLGLRLILTKAESADTEKVVAGKIKQWNDQYYVFLIPAVIIMLYLMHTRVLFVLAIALLCYGINDNLYAASLSDAFKNSEQKGKEMYANGNFLEAAETFIDPYRKGVALYRAGDFASAEQQFKLANRSTIKTSALFNAGNAQMRQRKWQSAIDSYEAVLAIEPENFAAQHNLEIARKMLEEEESKPKQCPNQSKQDKENQSEQEDSQANNDKNDNPPENNEQDKESQQAKNPAQHEGQNNAQQNQESQQKQTAMQNESSNEQETNNRQAEIAATTLSAEEEEKIEQWLKRVDSDIKIFLKNKFYIEDALSAQN